MANRLEQFYSAFQGMDTRSNKLNVNQKSFRSGAKNFRYNFQDEIQKFNGFQHKSIYGFTAISDVEYKYTDVDTGEEKTQFLCVASDGNLYKKRFQYIKFTSLGTATKYSYYYDEVSDSFLLKFDSYSAITVSETMTMDDLRIAINTLGMSCVVVDEDGNTISGSTKLAYLLDVVIDKSLSASTITEMNTQYWDVVLSGGSDVPFPTSRDYNTDQNYQGASYVNINNVCIITDGGFPMKYDGYVVYRVGQPKILAPLQSTSSNLSYTNSNYNYSGFYLGSAIVPSGGVLGSYNSPAGLVPNSTYQYVFQIVSVDNQSVEVVGGYDIGEKNLYIKQTLARGENAIAINFPALSGDFNWFRCKVKGNQNILTGGGYIDVYPNHNVSTGLSLRVPIANRQQDAFSGNVATTSGSNIVTGIPSNTRVALGAPVSGTNFPARSFITGIYEEGTKVQISSNATATSASTDLRIKNAAGYSYMITKVISSSYGYDGRTLNVATTTSGSKVVTNIDTSGVSVGSLVEGFNIAANSRVASVDSSTQVTLDTNATASGTDDGFIIYGRIQVQKGLTESQYTTQSLQYPFQRFVQNQPMTLTSGSSTATLATSITTQSLTTVSGSTTVTLTSARTDLMVGMFVDVTGLATNTKITQVVSDTSIVVSNAATASATNAAFFAYDYTGYYLAGEGVQEQTFITSQTGRTITMNKTASSSAVLSPCHLFKNITLLVDDQTVSAGKVSSEIENKITDFNFDNLGLPEMFNGSAIRVWRTTSNTSNFYHLIDMDIPSINDFVFYDNIPDTELRLNSSGTPFQTPTNQTMSRISLVDSDQGGELPRACKYLSKWQDFIIQMGRPVNTGLKDESYPTYSDNWPPNYPSNDWGDNTTFLIGSTYTEASLCDYQSIYWNDSAGSEAFSRDGLHEFKITTTFDDQIKGGIANKDAFFAFKERSTGVLVGSLAENSIQLEILEGDVGCASHRSIQEVGGRIIWLDANNGFFSCVAGRLPVNIGFNIVDAQKINPLKLDWSKAISANFRKENLYFCSVENVTYVFDYAANGNSHRDCWYVLDRFNVKSLISTPTDELYLSDGSRQWKFKNTNTKYDFTDHKSAYKFVLNTQWLGMGTPSIDKKFLNLWVNSIQGGFTLDFYQYQNFLDYSISDLLAQPFLAESADKKIVKGQFKAANPKMASVSFGMENNEKNQFVRIQGYEVQYEYEYATQEPQK